MQMQAVLDDWNEHAEGHASTNLAFLRSLEPRAEKAINRTAHRLHKEAFAKIDCTRCANCCKTMVPTFTDDEAGQIAHHLRMSSAEFVVRYLVRSSDDGRLRPASRFCSFLGADRRCTIYEFRPASCIDFPHTNRARFAASADFHSENAIYCPAVFYVIEQMRAQGDKVNRGTGRTTSAPCGPFA